MTLVAAAAAAVAAAASPARRHNNQQRSLLQQKTCTACKRPAWSWDTVGHMSFTHTCNTSGPWSEEALDVLQKFQMVNIERFAGQHQSCFARRRKQWGPPGCWLNTTHGNPACNTNSGGLHHAGCNCTCEEAPFSSTPDARGLYVEDHTLAALRQLKRRNPNISTIFYHDSGRMWTNDQIANWGRVGPQTSKYWNPTVYRADNYIVGAQPTWLLRNSSDQFVWDHYANNHVYDHSQPDVQNYWMEICLNATNSGAADGCFADYASMGGFDPAAPGQPASVGVKGVMKSWNVTKDKAVSWINGHQAALKTLTRRLGDGVLIANGGRNKFTNGFMLETFTPSQIGTIQSAAADGVVNQVHANMYGSGPHKTNADVRDALAAFLIGTGPYQYFSGPYGWQISQTCDDPLGLRDIRRRWLPEFDKALGKAKGLGLLDKHTNTYTRIFGAGTTVTFNRTSGQGTIQWSDGTVTRGPGCAPSAPKCQNCFPPMYEQGSLADGTGGCVES
jgi:hypothetical protein